MSSEVFIISSAQDADAPAALRQAVEAAGVKLALIQDAVFGMDLPAPWPDTESILRTAGLQCPSASVLSGLRAIYFCAATILSEDIDLAVVAGMSAEGCTAFVFASAEAVGRLNLLPRARLAARSLTGPEAAFRFAGIASDDVALSKQGGSTASLLHELIDELEASSARWGMLTVGDAVLLIERL